MEEAICLVDAIGLNCVIRRAREDKTLSSQLVTGAWRVFCYSCPPTHSLVDQFIAWRATEWFFAEFFGFLFDNTSRCYLVFAFFFPTLLAFILLLISDEYGLEQLYCLFAHIYYIPHLV